MIELASCEQDKGKKAENHQIPKPRPPNRIPNLVQT
jgi:hypothetical protein